MKTALITGAGIGLGKRSAEALAAAGYHVILTDVLPEEGRGAAEAIIAAGGSAEYRDMDVTDSDAVNAVIGAVEEQHGPLTALVLNAGIAKTIPLDGMADDSWDLTQEVNLKGMMRVLRAAAPKMRAAKQGAVVCLTSVVGPLLGWAEHIPYSASKGGVAGFVKAAALELAPDELNQLKGAAEEDWSQVRPEIFGTIFEHSLETKERHAFGAHFTSSTRSTPSAKTASPPSPPRFP